MKVIVTRNCSAAGKSLTAHKNPVNLDDATARELIAANKAIPAPPDEKPKKAAGK